MSEVIVTLPRVMPATVLEQVTLRQYQGKHERALIWGSLFPTSVCAFLHSLLTVHLNVGIKYIIDPVSIPNPLTCLTYIMNVSPGHTLVLYCSFSGTAHE